MGRNEEVNHEFNYMTFWNPDKIYFDPSLVLSISIDWVSLSLQ